MNEVIWGHGVGADLRLNALKWHARGIEFL